MFNVDLTGEYVTFFILAVIIIGGAVLMISLEKVVHMVISMAAAFLGLAGMYVLLEAEFVAFVQVLIYAGAVSILMIFGIMMTKHNGESAEPVKPLHKTLAAVGALCLFGLLFYAIRASDLQSAGAFHSGEDNTLAIGEQLFTGYIVPFELLSILLTVAFIGAIALAKKEAD
ncbi:NADH-quinone oxidoreductase subunit J [Paenibacillus sp. 1011MAR3C5]|uniref:NADH-quinone oxidoreductase subunit J n=1 Tax=Paenibacillus sp. 1011MAR3C5 TaxID=1675787 RepID=UPI000E6B9B56|nr:NADH-quinone oxidoreductase subunit J [Paenibacillus sp. 1011MAR3C5]RJE85597.1 NADH-quinone oxidoreductase subunit J [Paenibacillus sp. 1011MAR3C5]